MKNHVKAGILGLVLYGCAPNKSSIDFSPIFNDAGPNERFMVAYEPYNSIPFNPEKPNEHYLPKPTIEQLQKELREANDFPRAKSIHRTIELKGELESRGFPVYLVRIAGNEALTAAGTVRDYNPTRIIFTMDRMYTHNDLERVRTGYKTKPADDIRMYGFGKDNKLVEYR